MTYAFCPWPLWKRRSSTWVNSPREWPSRALRFQTLNQFPRTRAVRAKQWIDYIDYWAVDWDFQNDIFTQGWAAYRTRKEKKLPLVSDSHAYEKAASYCILVRVIDIFGNDTRQAFAVEVR